MKKVLAIVLALAMVLSLSLVTFANSDTVVSSDFVMELVSSESAADNSSDAGVKTTVAAGSDVATLLAYDLIPGTTYKFRIVSAQVDGYENQFDSEEEIYTAVNGATGVAKTYDFKIEWTEGKDLFETFEVSEGVDEYFLTITPKASYETASEDFSVKVTLRDKDRTVGEDFVLSIKEGTVRDVASVITSYQDITDSPILITKDEDSVEDAEILAGNYAKFVVTTDSNQANRYVGYTTAPIQEVIDANPSVDMNFISFVANPSFNRLGTMYLYASEDQYVYQVTDGVISTLEAEYDDDEEAYVFSTRTLGAYIIADEEIENVDLSTDDDSDSTTSSSTSSETDSSDTTSEDKDNPDTGSHDMIGIAVTLGMVSLAAAGAVGL